VGSRRAERPSSGLDGAGPTPVSERQRARMLKAVAEVVSELGFQGSSSARVSGRAGVSRKRVDVLFEGREAVLLAAFEQALALASGRARAAYDAREGWVDGIRAALVALLEFFDEQPVLARYCVVGSGPAVLARRSEVLDRLALVLDDERAPARGYPPPLTAEAVVSGVLGVLHGRLCKPNPGVLVELSNPLMSFIVLPFLGARAARRELRRPVEASSPVERSVPLDLLRDPGGSVSHHRMLRVLGVIGVEPGLNSSEVGLRAGVKDQGRMSRILARLQRFGLIENTRDAHRRGDEKAWQLTADGQELEAAIRHEATVASVAFDLPEAFRGRLDYRAVSVLRVIGDEPWLTGERAGSTRGGQRSGPDLQAAHAPGGARTGGERAGCSLPARRNPTS
jgi:AcrR family transcriptional regulator/DNA-binding MarR family transcriptional regulator